MAQKLALMVMEKKSELEVADEAEEVLLADDSETVEATGNKSVAEKSKQTLVNELGELVFDDGSMQTQGDSLYREKPLYLAANAAAFNWLEGIFLWVAEMMWMLGVFFVFFIRSVFITVLVMFGPIYMVCSLLETWKDK